jgi:hypothetical protein
VSDTKPGTDYRLRNHIPLGAPARREPLVGDEPALRVSLGFAPRWFHRRVDVDFGARWHLDPLYRYRSLLRMKREVNRAFPMVPDFQVTMKGDVEPTCATLSGVHGIMLLPMLYGIEPVYGADRWPDARAGMGVDKERLMRLAPLDLESHPVMGQLFEQMDLIEREWGAIHGYLNYQGVLNVAVKVRGGAIFTDMIDDPPFVHAFLDHIARTIESVSKRVQARQRRSGFAIDMLSLSNCVVVMISPQQYEIFVLPHDLRLSHEYARFGIHTCNWDATPYLGALRRIRRMGYLDTGMMADLRRIREIFPDARRAVMVGPVELETKPLDQIRADMERLAADYAPCDIVMADVDHTTPDERVRDFLRIARETEQRMLH